MPVTEVHQPNHADAAAPRRRRKTTAERREPQPQVSAPTATPRDLEVEPAPMWRRLVARTVDMVAVFTWMFALSIAYIFFHLQLWSDTVAPEPWGNWFLATMTFTICFAVYEITFISQRGATPGKDLMGVQVVDDTTGGRPSVGQAARRWFLPGIVQPIPGAWVSGLLTLIWGATGFTDRNRRTIYDRMAGTRVIAKDPPSDDDEREHRRRQFTPRFVDPFMGFRAARAADPDALRRHPEETGL